MNSPDLIRYRLRLADGFMQEAEQDFALERWRSCVDNAQLAAENAGKAVMALFGVVPRTHDPAQQIARILRAQDLPQARRELMEGMLPDLLALGSAEHFLTDYGDEVAYKSPWELFDKDAAASALEAARRSVDSARKILRSA
ncbi:MAG: HEPN domain-containing protein [Acidobacteria bacterium]|nr:HEPN domain-containing protein [Acidobacteriota bacterium]